MAWLERVFGRRMPEEGLLRHVSFLMPDGVYSVDEPPRRAAVRCGSLAAYVEHLAPLSLLRARAQQRGAIGPGWTLAERMAELRFCLTDLLPFLRGLDGSADRSPPAPSADDFLGIEARAAELRSRLEADLELPPPEILAGWLGAPCALLGRQIVPLEPVPAGGAARDAITIQGERYRLRREDAMRSAELRTRLQLEVGRLFENALRRDLRATALARALAEDVEGLVAPHRLGSTRGYELFHQDRVHELQHHRGHWMLVRGPVEHRLRDDHRFYVGLAIEGWGPGERLRARPTHAATKQELWSHGVPVESGLCVGASNQYAWLLSSRLGDAEAIVHWLDAGVILLTGRSDLHRRMRVRARLDAARDPQHRGIITRALWEDELEPLREFGVRQRHPAPLLFFDPRALERCFLAADVLRDEFGQPRMEYAFLGLSSARSPYHVVTTLLLPEQRVTTSSVVQRGRDVLRMRGEIDRLSRRLGQSLQPAVFVHRHNGCCDASQTDREFLCGAFVNQLSSLSPRAVAFSLIVNEAREHRLYAVRRTRAANGRPGVEDLTARLVVLPYEPAWGETPPDLRAELVAEIRARLRFAADEGEAAAS